MALVVMFTMCAFSPLGVSYPEIDNIEIELMSSTNRGVIIKVLIPTQQTEFSPVDIDGQSYVSLNLPGAALSGLSSAPALPVITTNLVIPHGAELELRVIPGKSYRKKLTELVLPAISYEDVTSIFNASNPQVITPEVVQTISPDPLIYATDQEFPGKFAEVTNMGSIRHQKVAGISIFPVQYNPVRGELILYQSLLIEVSFIGTVVNNSSSQKIESEIYGEIFDRNLLNYDPLELGLDNPNAPKYPFTDEFNFSVQNTTIWLPPNPSWRIKIRDEGFYQLTYAELAMAGLPVDEIDPSTFQVYYLGREMAMRFTGDDDSVFEEGENLLFYGQAIDSKYTLDNVYWLTYDNQQGLRIQTRDVSPISATIPEDYAAKISFEQNLRYVQNIPDLPSEQDTDRFFWDLLCHPSMSGCLSSWSHEFFIMEPYDGSGNLEITLLGYSSSLVSDLDHHAKILLNGINLGDLHWDGKTWNQSNLLIPSGTLKTGTNTIKVELPGDTATDYESIAIDDVAISYSSAFQSQLNKLKFTYENEGLWKFIVQGFSINDLALFDLNDPFAIVALTGYEVQAEGLDYKIIFEDEVLSTQTYWIEGRAELLQIESIEKDIPSNLHSLSNAADYLLISHPDFLLQAESLAAFRSAQGLRTVLIDLQDIYDEFAYGVVGVKPIKDFLTYAYQNWVDPAPSYVLLVGDSHYDPNNHLGFGRESYLPSYLAAVDPVMWETAADNRYVTFVGEDLLPDMMIGRLAVNSPTEAEAFITKIIAYEQAPASGDWKRQVLALSDNLDTGGDFPSLSSSLLSSSLPDYYQAEEIYMGDTHATLSEARTDFLAGINAGKLIINYIGHASYSQWAGYDNDPNLDGDLFRYTDIDSLSNNGKYPVILSMTCRDGYFINPEPQGGAYDALAEVITKVPAKGAVASWSPTGTGIATGHSYLNEGFFNAIFSDKVDTLGDAIIAAKLSLWASGAYLDLLDTYTLFGDPATIFLRTLIADDESYMTEEDLALNIAAADGILVNDLNPRGSLLIIHLLSDVSNGTLNLSQDGSFTYVPNPGFVGMDSFNYAISDGFEQSNSAEVQLRILSTNKPPVALNQDIITLMNLLVNITLSATDDGGASPDQIIPSKGFDPKMQIQQVELTFEVLTEPIHGALTGSAPDLIYTPDTNYVGTDKFTFWAFDGEKHSNIATINLNIQAAMSLYLPMISK